MWIVSIHTSAREVTEVNKHKAKQSIVSIHTSAREVTNSYFSTYKSDLVSIHTSAREVTIFGKRCINLCMFQSTLPQGK